MEILRAEDESLSKVCAEAWSNSSLNFNGDILACTESSSISLWLGLGLLIKVVPAVSVMVLVRVKSWKIQIDM